MGRRAAFEIGPNERQATTPPRVVRQKHISRARFRRRRALGVYKAASWLGALTLGLGCRSAASDVTEKAGERAASEPSASPTKDADATQARTDEVPCPDGATGNQPCPAIERTVSGVHGSESPTHGKEASTHAAESGVQGAPQLVATTPRTPIYQKPDVRSRRLGYLRAGQVVARGETAVRGEGCLRFYAIEPRGFVCVGVDASLELDHPARRVNIGQPKFDDALPYVYGKSRYPTPPRYTRIPTPAEQSRTEPLIERYLPRRDVTPWLKLGLDEVPDFLLDHAPSYHVNGVRKGRALTEGYAFVTSGYAFVRRFAVGERLFGLTTDLEVLPLDRLDLVQPSVFHGVELSEGVSLPLAFVRQEGATLYIGEPDLGLTPGRQLSFREVVQLSGVQQVYDGETYWQATDGQWLLQTSRVTVVEPRGAFPTWADERTTWIDVSLLRQTLVAYERQTPKYVTLISSGKDGVRDARTSQATLQGQFVIHTKHVTAPMSGSGEGGSFDLKEVPYVQYFSGGYGLHTAYWHDSFGQPKSHGCINLSPLDARWLFHWTEPKLPDGWHGVMDDGGTWITIHR